MDISIAELADQHPALAFALKKAVAEGGRYAFRRLNSLSATSRLEQALRQDQEELLAIFSEVLRGFCVRAGVPITRESAEELIGEIAFTPDYRPRLRAAWNEAARSSHERAAMLAAACFVGAQPASIQERIDRAAQQLLPEDATVLGDLVELAQRRTGDQVASVIEPRHGVWRLALVLDDAHELFNQVSQAAILSLSGAHCLMIGGWVTAESTNVTTKQQLSVPWTRVDLTAVGMELYTQLSLVDWRAIAAVRRASAPLA